LRRYSRKSAPVLRIAKVSYVIRKNRESDGSSSHLPTHRPRKYSANICIKTHVPSFPTNWIPLQWVTLNNKKSKAIRVRGKPGPYGCETSRLPYCLDSRLTNGGEVVSLTRRPPFTPRKIPGIHFYQRLSRPQGHNAAGRIRSTQKDYIILQGINSTTFRLVA
jgi:hypothetical protein